MSTAEMKVRDDVLASAKRALEAAQGCGCKVTLTNAQAQAVLAALGGEVTP
jgi:hypothetical protein